MKNIIVVTLLVAATATTLTGIPANAQWGSGGGAGAILEGEEIPLNSRRSQNMRGVKDVLDDIHGFDDGERPAQEAGKPTVTDFSKMETQADGTQTFKSRQGSGGGRGGAGGPSPRDDEYVDTWMPSARKGFEVPERYKRTLNLKPNDRYMDEEGNVNADDEDIEEIMNDRARREMPTKAPGVETRRIDKCLRQVAKYCSFNTMDSDFAAFTQCCFDVRHYVKQSCFEWCENHGRCAADMAAHCANKGPMDTTECMVAKKEELTTDCSDSPYFKSLEEGIDHMREDRRHAEATSKDAMPNSSPSADDGPRFGDKDDRKGNTKDNTDDSFNDNEDDVETIGTTFTDEL